MAHAVPLVEEYRGKLLDLIHYGYVCVVDENGKVIYHAGDPDAVVFYRSASKPIQALPVISRRLDEKYGLTEEESTIFSASHQGDTFHVEALESIFKKAGFTEDMLVMKPTVPQVKHDPDITPRKFYHNCSGKHSGALLLQRALGGEVRDYWKEDSPAQKEIKRVVALVSEFPEDRIQTALDGCGVPVFAMEMKNIATAFKNLALPDRIPDPDLADAAKRYIPRMHKYPHMIRGNNMLCTMINMDDAIVAKGGANGTYGIGLKKLGMGISIKMQDGVETMWPLVIAHVLRTLGHDNEATFEMLEKLCPRVLVNDNGTPCGERRPAFELTATR